MRVVAIVVFTLLNAVSAFADTKQAQSCASALAPESKLIYDASAADVTAGGDIKSIVEAKTRALVIGGQLARSNARPSAEAAGACLKLLKS